MNQISKKSKESEGISGEKKAVLAGAGIAALVATAAGAYFLYGSKDAGKRRKKVKSWALKAKGEILEKLESLSEVSEDIYHRIVKEAADRYQDLKSIEPEELQEFRSELKSNWGKIKNEITSAVSKKNIPALKVIKKKGKKSSR